MSRWVQGLLLVVALPLVLISLLTAGTCLGCLHEGIKMARRVPIGWYALRCWLAVMFYLSPVGLLAMVAYLAHSLWSRRSVPWYGGALWAVLMVGTGAVELIVLVVGMFKS